MKQQEITTAVFYLTFIAIATFVEHKYIYVKWKKHERARWAVAWGTLLFPLVPLVIWELVDLYTLGLVFFGALTAGGAIWLMDVNSNVMKEQTRADELVQQIRRRVNEGNQEADSG